MSTKIDRTGKTETRVLSPFGIIDLTFRKVLDGENQKTSLEIDVGGDAECWVSHNSAITEFRSALLHLVWGIAKEEHLIEEAQFCFDEVKMHVKGEDVSPLAEYPSHRDKNPPSPRFQSPLQKSMRRMMK